MSDKNTTIQQKKTINAAGRLIDFDKAKVMGILNVTPDSFYKVSRISSVTEALRTAEQMLAEGADFIDIGAYSSRPGAEHISIAEEKKRLIPVIQAIAANFPKAIISADTFRAEVARAAVNEGAAMINDISGGDLDVDMFKTIAELKIPYILMHMKGNPQNMKNLAVYNDIFTEIMHYFSEKMRTLIDLGLKDIIIDPGFGFAKTIHHNYQLLNRFDLFKLSGCPVLAGLSRKSMIWKSLEINPDEALNGTTVLNTIALLKGADILRVHDVTAARQAIKLVDTVKNALL